MNIVIPFRGRPTFDANWHLCGNCPMGINASGMLSARNGRPSMGLPYIAQTMLLLTDRLELLRETQPARRRCQHG
jgi:hypothetical protein